MKLNEIKEINELELEKQEVNLNYVLKKEEKLKNNIIKKDERGFKNERCKTL